ncbi:MAG: DUF1275 domain-containing protein [Ahniella sp.]|nr:DUF1275 domain-containing protein [Ahniella sp.]
MITRLPPWVGIGAGLLALIAGSINVIALLELGMAVTHLTGTTSLLAAALVGAKPMAFAPFAWTIFAYLLGTIVSGVIIQDSMLRLGRRYSVALLIESLLLWLAIPLISHHLHGGLICLAAAAGLQNAMVSTYSGALLRTTHLTGMFTDLGVFIGHALRGLPVQTRRLRLCLIVISGFFAGGLLGAWTHELWSLGALMVPASLTALLAAFYWVYYWLKAGQIPSH